MTGMANDGTDVSEFRQELYELDSAMDSLRRKPDSIAQLAVLAAERDTLVDRLQNLMPEGADIGYQRNADEPFVKVDNDGPFIPIMPGDASGTA